MSACTTCGAYWSEGQFTKNCEECGGFAMTRSCPTCQGQCGAIWRRQVNMSNALGVAYFKGGCRLNLLNGALVSTKK